MQDGNILKKTIVTLAIACLAGWLGLALQTACAEDKPAAPSPTPELAGMKLIRAWKFPQDAADSWSSPLETDGWNALNNTKLSVVSNRLVIACTGDDPYLGCPVEGSEGPVVLRFRARSTQGSGQIFWTTASSGAWSDDKSRILRELKWDNAWHDYAIPLDVFGKLASFRLDPGDGAGTMEIEKMELFGTPPRAVIPDSQGADFCLQDFLGRTWSNECVSFPLTEAQAAHLKADRALRDDAGAEVTFQLEPASKGETARIAFQADLNPFQTRKFNFAETPAMKATDLGVKEEKDQIVLSNGRTGIALRKKLAAGEGPIAAIRLNSGTWVGDSTLESAVPPSEYSVEITARGPVFSEAVCRVAFGKDSKWLLRIRLHAREPVILADEKFNVKGDGIQCLLDFNRNFSPDTVLYRSGNKKPAVGKIGMGQVFILEPWRQWWSQDRQGASFGLFRAGTVAPNIDEQPAGGGQAPDLLAFGAREPGVWVQPAVPGNLRSPIQLWLWKGLLKDEARLTLPLPLKCGERKWMISALSADDGLTLLKGKPLAENTVILPDQYLIKHSHFPLDAVKDYVLQWPNAKDTYPRLFVKKEELPALRKAVPNPEAYANAVAGFRKATLSRYAVGGELPPSAVYYVTGDPEVGRSLSSSTVALLQNVVDFYTKQEQMFLGVAPHVQMDFVAGPIAMADAGLADEQLAPGQRRRILAQLAFLGYVYGSPTYWSPERGFAANPNMTTLVNGYKMMVACLIPSHPCAAEWAEAALKETRKELATWADDNGGWLEAPHYAAIGIEQLNANLVMARNAGLDDNLYSPRMKKIGEWLAKISTPPDSRFGGFRHLPPIGNTYLNEPNGIFGTLAMLWKDKDPTFAANMQWMFLQQRSWPGSFGGGYPGMIGCNCLYRGAAMTPQAPAWGSDLFPQTGVVLRHRFPSDRETYLTLIAGANHAHYDDDSGSITLWGRGRVLADDFGYCGRAPQDDHSMLSTAGAGGVMTVNVFTNSAGLDYVRGTKGPWTRQIALVKSTDPQEADYFIVADTLAAAAPYTWRLWLTARDVRLGSGSGMPAAAAPPQTDTMTNAVGDGTAMDLHFAKPTAATRALAIGREDVDMDIFVLAPAQPLLRTEKKMRQSLSGLDRDAKQIGNMPTTQIGLIADAQPGTGLTALLYPRLKTEAAPSVTVIAEGRGVQLQRNGNTDYVFLSASPFDYKDGQLTFHGTVGSMQLRGGKPAFSLGAPGKIAFGAEQKVMAEKSE